MVRHSNAWRVLRFAGLLLLALAFLPLALSTRLLGRLGARRPALRMAARVQHAWARSVLAVLGVEVTVEGHPPAGAFLVVANHLSYLDIPVLASLFPGRFVAKSEIAGWPVLGWLARTVGTIFVVQKKTRDMKRVEREMKATLAAGVPVLLFPEGHSTRGVTVDRLHSALLEAAAHARIPCLAVALGYETPGAPWAPASSVCWWGGMGFWRHAWNLVGLPLHATVRIAPESVVGHDRKELASALHARIVARFVPVRQAPIAPDFPWPEIFASSEGGDRAAGRP
jgi:1-acyl-sn-glycerol-3-phosphate acyltransferase